MTTRRKYSVLALVWLVLVISYLGCTNISVIAPSLMRELGISPSEFGMILSAFAAGYGLSQLSSHYFSERFGIHKTLLGSLILWSLLTGLTGFATSFVWLLLVRLFIGISAGLTSGIAFKLMSNYYFVAKQRSCINSIYLSPIAIGPALAVPLVTWSLKYVGWQIMFSLFTLPGFYIAWLLMRYLPRRLHTHRIHKIWSNEPSAEHKKITYQHWLIIIAYLGLNTALWGYLGWLPSYLAYERHLTLSELGYAASISYAFGLFGLLGLGILTSPILQYQRGGLLAGIYCCAAITLLSAYFVSSTVNCVILLALSTFLMYGSLGPAWSLLLESSVPRAQSAFALGTRLTGHLGSIIAPALIGYMVERTGVFAQGFFLMVAGLSIAALAALLYQCIPSLSKHRSQRVRKVR